MTTPIYKKACIFGGTGFVGRQIVRELAAQGYIIKVATRVTERANFLKVYGNVGQIVPFVCDYRDEASIRDAVKGCDIVVNCAGILYESSPTGLLIMRGRRNFQSVHVDYARAIAKAARAESCKRLIHISALGCEQGTSKYAKTKRGGELAVLENFPAATILRPSVIFGAEDNFFNLFAKLPVLPLIGGGKTKFQPVYVGDVADAVGAALAHPGTTGKIYELGGPDIITFKDVFAIVARQTGRKKPILPIPSFFAKLQACVFGLLPFPPLLTADQVESLKTDTVVAPGALGFHDLGLVPRDMDVILPSYLERYRPGGRFGDKKRA